MSPLQDLLGRAIPGEISTRKGRYMEVTTGVRGAGEEQSCMQRKSPNPGFVIIKACPLRIRVCWLSL
jgi:hypothetical protein